MSPDPLTALCHFTAAGVLTAAAHKAPEGTGLPRSKLPPPMGFSIINVGTQIPGPLTSVQACLKAIQGQTFPWVQPRPLLQMHRSSSVSPPAQLWFPPSFIDSWF